MDEQDARSIHERLERLESIVEKLQATLGQTAPADEPPTPAPAPEPIRKAIFKRPSPPARGTRGSSLNLPKGESWLKILGIGLILFGLTFLFKYSIDQGWLTESVRVGMGLVLGTLLFGIGLRIRRRRRSYSQALLGGAIAAYYITGFAAFQLYALVSHPVAFGFMVLVTILAFIFSLQQGEALLSILGAVGGLGTPFLLYTGSGSLPGLIGYSCLILAGTSAVYLFRGWRSLLLTSTVGGWAVFIVGQSALDITSPWVTADRWALQLGTAFGCLAFWALPLVREALTGRHPDRWPRPPLDAVSRLLPSGVRDPLSRHVHLLSVSTPLIALALFQGIWDSTTVVWGSFAMGCAGIWALAAWALKDRPGCRPLAYTQALVSLLLLTAAFCLLLEGDTLFLTIAAEAAVLHLISRRLDDRGTAIGGHLLAAAAAFVLYTRLLSTEVAGMPVLNSHALSNLAVLGIGLAFSFVHRTRDERLVYRLAGHLGLLGWSLRELSSVEGGQGYVTIAWGIYAILLLVVGLRRNLDRLRMAAMATLLLVVAKLFLIDLARLETIWRILLFLGFGGVFLVLGYYFQALWKPTSTPGRTSSDTAPLSGPSPPGN